MYVLIIYGTGQRHKLVRCCENLRLCQPFHDGGMGAFYRICLFRRSQRGHGSVVQNAVESGKADRDMIHQSVLAQRRALRDLLARLFNLIDTNHSGEISLAELENWFHTDEIQAYFESWELEVESAWDLFKLLDMDDTTSIDMSEFVSGCMRLRGGAREISVCSLMRETRCIAMELHDFRVETDQLLHFLISCMQLQGSDASLMLKNLSIRSDVVSHTSAGASNAG